jgi:hypothetical protein
MIVHHLQIQVAVIAAAVEIKKKALLCKGLLMI